MGGGTMMDMHKTISAALALVVVLCLAFYLLSLKNQPHVSVEDVLPTGWVRSVSVDQGITYAYPATFDGTYFSAVEWPPSVERVSEYSCVSPATERPIDGQTYCVTLTSEGAAGSSYLTYGYMTDRGDIIVRTDFTIRFPQCLNYDEPNQAACKAEQATIDPDTLATRIIISVKISEN